MTKNNEPASPHQGDLTGATSTGNAKSGNISQVSVDERLQLVDRMLRDALDQESPVLASLQMNGADLLEMSLVLKKAIMDSAKACSKLTELKELQSFMETYVKLCRQADRMLRLKHEIAEASDSGSPARVVALVN